jgi:O-antigen ligase
VTIFGLYVLVALAAAMAGVSFQHSFWSDYRRMGGVFDLAHWFAFVVVLVNVFRSRRHWWWLLNANLGVSLVVALMGLYQHFNVTGLDAVLWYLRPMDRLDISFGNPTYVGAYMLVNSLIAVAMLVSSSERVAQPLGRPVSRRRARSRPEESRYPASLAPWRVFWVSVLLLDLWVLVLSGTRGALFGLLVGVFVAGVGYVLWGDRRRWRIVAGALMAGALLFVLLLPTVRTTGVFRSLADNNTLVERVDKLAERGVEDRSLRARIITATTGLDAFMQRPILGWGPENFAMAFDRHAETRTLPKGSSTLADQAHNKPIEELVTKGMLGLAAYLLLLGRVSWVVVRSVRNDRQERWFAMLMGSATAAYFVQNLFLFDTPGTFLQFILLLAWAAWKDSTQAEVETATVASRADADTQPAWTRVRSWFERRGASSNALTHTATGLVTVVTLYSLILFNFLPYRAGQTFPLQASSVGEFLSRAQASSQTFPPLATLPRIILFNTVTSHWDSLSEEDVERVAGLVRLEGEAAIRSEPQNLRVFQALAELYQKAAVTAPKYAETARAYVDRTAELGPRVTGVHLLVVRQELLEGNYQQALDLIAEYDEVPSRIHWTLMGLRDAAKRLMRSAE